MKRPWLRVLALPLLAAAVLSGCASGYLLENHVQSFSGLPALSPNPTYTFERLPSQANQPGQSQLEAYADPALHRAGLRRDDASPRYTVQVSARVQRVVSPWADPWDPWGHGPWGHPFYGPGVGIGFGFGAPFPRMEQAWFQREVGIVVRDKASNRVVYETRASSDGPWLDPSVVLPAMFEAALQGFPNPPAGPRRVNLQIGGNTQQAAAPPAPAAAPLAPAGPAPAR